MAFKLELMTAAERKEVFLIHADVIGKYCFVSERAVEDEKIKWAIDVEKSAKFLRLPAIEPRDGVDRYILIFDGFPLIVQMGRDESIAPLDIPLAIASKAMEIRETILQAFVVYGFYGVERPVKELDIPTPTFY